MLVDVLQRGNFSLLHEASFCNRQMSQVFRNVGRWHSPVNPINFFVCVICVSFLYVGIMFIWVYHVMYHFHMCGSF